MPIEGPLRELGIHDVFQLLDLSRKTGLLRVTSQLRNDEGAVFFDQGKVVHAAIRSKPSMIDAATFPERELERKIRQQIENTVFDLMSWREGFFSFEEREIDEIPPGSRVEIAAESLIMESARRIDEWSRIADKVPNLSVVPVLADASEEHETQLDLLPHEWEVLSMIDGRRDLHAIASTMGRGEFDVAKVVYGLIATGVVDVHNAGRHRLSLGGPSAAEAQQHLELGFTAVRAGNLTAARASFEHFLQLAPTSPSSERARIALDAVNKLLKAMEVPGHG